MSTLVTGFPGFLGTGLVERLLARDRSVRCLVQPRYESLARERAENLLAAADGGDVRLLLGDLTEPELGLADPAAVREATSEVFHLAAVYDLGMARSTGLAVNVEGTRRMLDLAQAADVERFHHVSTCYVSGRHGGRWGPDDLQAGQTFKNHYEETKFLAEAAVQARLAEGLPATVYRPAIVVGDSETGETRKTDGPYYFLRLIQRQPGVAAVPVHPGGGGYTMNVVPRDFVLDAMTTIADQPGSAGQVYQLCSPDPPTIREIVRAFGAALDKRVVPVAVPRQVTRAVLERLPGLADWLRVEPAAIDYLGDGTTYIRPKTDAALAGTDVSCPSFRTYARTLVEYVEANPELTDAAMR